MTTRDAAGRDLRLGFRVTERERSLLREASRTEGMTVSEFVLRHATRAAEQVLADRRTFSIPPERWDAFVAALDGPPKNVTGLRDLVRETTVLDRE